MICLEVFETKLKASGYMELRFHFRIQSWHFCFIAIISDHQTPPRGLFKPLEGPYSISIVD